MKKRAIFKICSIIVVLLLWVGCGPPPVQQQPNTPKVEIIPAQGEHTTPEHPGNTAVPPEHPDDKPNDPTLLDLGSSSKWIGDACLSDRECSFSGGYCMKTSNGFPNGYCMRSCTKYCPDRSGRPFTFCVKRGSKGACFSRCDKSLYPGTGCRSGYKCRVETRYRSRSIAKGICVPDPNSKPVPKPPTGTTSKWIGENCTNNAECTYSGGYCRKSNGASTGYCSRSCTRSCPDKVGKPTTFCVDGGAGGVCVSRCDIGTYASTGCNAGYTCQQLSRYKQSWVTRKVCIPARSSQPQQPDKPKPPVEKPRNKPQPPSRRGLVRTPGLSCYAQLTKWGVNYVKISNPNTKLRGASRRCSISQAIRVTAPIMGVDWVIWTKKRVRMTMSCELGIRLARFSYYLKQRGIKKVMHLGTYNCRKIRGSSRLSNHSFGAAIDLAAFYSNSGTEYNIVKHWDHSTTWKKGGNMGCWSSRFNSRQAKFLYEIGCDMWKQKFFSLILSPNYNRDHDNHFHVDLTSTGKVLSSVGYIGTADGDLGGH